MKTRASFVMTAAAILALVGCQSEEPSTDARPRIRPRAEAPETKKTTLVAHRATEAKSVAFAVGSCTDEDPATAARTAAYRAIDGLGCPAKGLIFYEYFPKTVKDPDGADKEVPDPEKEKTVLPALRSMASSRPVIGCRGRPLTTDGTKLANTVTVLAIGGDAVSCKAARAELAEERTAVGASIAQQLADVADLKVVIALSRMHASSDTTEGVPAEDFIRGVLETAGENVTLFGGHCLPSDPQAGDLGSVQFYEDQTLSGHVVAMGIGGPVDESFGDLRRMFRQHTAASTERAEPE